MTSRWQANKIGLLNFWYYDEQEFPFVKGRMLLRGANGSGKSVTMQSVVPLLLDGNMSPERLDPFGSKDRKMAGYLLEENDGREERTGYLYLEFKRQDSDVYAAVGMGIRARRGKNLDKWYFGLTDGRRIGKDFLLYRNRGEKIPVSKKELENQIGDGGVLFDKQSDYMEYVNRVFFGFETVEEYKEMVDLLLRLRTPKLSKDFKPTVLNDILSSSLQPLSDDDLRPMSEAIENMDALTLNLQSRMEAKQAAKKIQSAYESYNQLILYEKADQYASEQEALSKEQDTKKQLEEKKRFSKKRSAELMAQLDEIEGKRSTMEQERESLRVSDAVKLKEQERTLSKEIKKYAELIEKKERSLEEKDEKYREIQASIKAGEGELYENEKEVKSYLEDMEAEAEAMSFQEYHFMKEELQDSEEKRYDFSLHKRTFEETREKIRQGFKIFEEIKMLERQRNDILLRRERNTRDMERSQREIAKWEDLFAQVQEEWKERFYGWNNKNQKLKLDDEVMTQCSTFINQYHVQSDYAFVRQNVLDVYIQRKMEAETVKNGFEMEIGVLMQEKESVQQELKAWEQKKEPEPDRSEAVRKNRKRLQEKKIPYQEFYKVIEYGEGLSEEQCNRLEEALLHMGILDAILVDSQYKAEVLQSEAGCADHYLFTGNRVSGKSLLDVLELNDAVNDIFFNQTITGILSSIAYTEEGNCAIWENGTYQLGPVTGTITGEYEAGFLGTKARERRRLARIEECRQNIYVLEEKIQELAKSVGQMVETLRCLENEYNSLPTDEDLKEVLRALEKEESLYDIMKTEDVRLENQILALVNQQKELRKQVIELSKKLYLDCSYEVFKEAAEAAEDYYTHLADLRGAYDAVYNRKQTIRHQQSYLEEIDSNMEQLRYDMAQAQKEQKSRNTEYASICEQLKLTDYEQIKARLDQCISWLEQFPEQLKRCSKEQADAENEIQLLSSRIEECCEQIAVLEQRTARYRDWYEKEWELGYVKGLENQKSDAVYVCSYLKSRIKSFNRDDANERLNTVYAENRSFLNDYQITRITLFEELVAEDMKRSHSPRRMDFTARYKGVKISFGSLVEHLEEDILELENLIKAGDRELFEDILANTVSRKIRGKINASNTWVEKMNRLMNGMNTSSSLKLSLKWRSRVAEKEEQLDTKDLVNLLKKDYRMMSEEEANKLAAHFRSKVEEARRTAKENDGTTSFYQIMKDTLDYRKWFEFQLFSQKNGERVKELTNSVFGTFSGGEKAMSMYVPLFSAVVAKYQGGSPDAPRLIALDEAFAGVDNRNISDMFRLMTEFQFDFIINSQVLWGDSEALDALAIYQLLRPENAKFVTVMTYLWNGRKKEMLESEAALEERIDGE